MPEMTRTCQCLNLGPDMACAALMTQEDLLCDECRDIRGEAHGCAVFGPSELAAGSASFTGSSPHMRFRFADDFFSGVSFLPRGS